MRQFRFLALTFLVSCTLVGAAEGTPGHGLREGGGGATGVGGGIRLADGASFVTSQLKLGES